MIYILSFVLRLIGFRIPYSETFTHKYKPMTLELKKQIQKEYEALPFSPGTDAVAALKELAAKHNITYEELLNTINL